MLPFAWEQRTKLGIDKVHPVFEFERISGLQTVIRPVLAGVRHSYYLPVSSFPTPPDYKGRGRILGSGSCEVSKNGIIYPCSLLARSVIKYLACSCWKSAQLEKHRLCILQDNKINNLKKNSVATIHIWLERICPARRTFLIRTLAFLTFFSVH